MMQQGGLLLGLLSLNCVSLSGYSITREPAVMRSLNKISKSVWHRKY